LESVPIVNEANNTGTPAISRNGVQGHQLDTKFVTSIKKGGKKLQRSKEGAIAKNWGKTHTQSDNNYSYS
jgi:hypothetical protein